MAERLRIISQNEVDAVDRDSFGGAVDALENRGKEVSQARFFAAVRYTIIRRASLGLAPLGIRR